MEKCWLALLTTIALYGLFHSGVVHSRSPLRFQGMVGNAPQS